MEQLELTKKTGFDKGDGVFAKALDDALASFNVERQAYYSGSFIGNHVHRCLQVHTCICICTSNHTHVCTCKQIMANVHVHTNSYISAPEYRHCLSLCGSHCTTALSFSD